MDYEKKYNEALKRAKAAIDIAADKDLVKGVATTIFPELRESENEMMMRVIGLALTDVPEERFASLGTTLRDCLAYLKKQEEQKPNPSNSVGLEQNPAEWSEDYKEENLQTRFAFYTYKDEPSTLYLSNVFVEEASRNHGFGTRILKAAEKVAETVGAITIRLKVKQDSPANNWYREYGYAYMTLEDGYDWLEKNLEYIKPKKSIKWSGDDELMIESLIAYLKGTKQDFISNDMVYWLESLPERFNLQPKQEWSEEDEKVLDFWLDVIDRNDWRMDEDFCKASREFINRLKSLRPQPQHHNTYYDIIHNILGSLKDIDFTQITPEHRVSLLNDIRVKCKNADECAALLDQPHWKPSEEQIKALQMVRDSHYFMYQQDRMSIETLLEQLKAIFNENTY